MTFINEVKPINMKRCWHKTYSKAGDKLRVETEKYDVK